MDHGDDAANNEADDVDDARSLQEKISDAMPEMPENRREMPDDDEFHMTMEEQRGIHDLIEGLVQTLYDRGYTPSELGIIFSTFDNRMNAARSDPHQYDRIDLSIQIRATIETWRDEQEKDVPPRVIAEVVEELGRHYRHMARRNLSEDADGDD